VNKAAFDQLDKPTQDAVLRVAAAAEARGWWRSQDRTKLVSRAAFPPMDCGFFPPSGVLKTGLQQIGERLTGEWVVKAGPDGRAVIDDL